LAPIYLARFASLLEAELPDVTSAVEAAGGIKGQDRTMYRGEASGWCTFIPLADPRRVLLRDAARWREPRMDRRVFLSILTGGVLTRPVSVNAQPAGKVWRRGVLSRSTTPSETARRLYAVNQSARDRGSISVYEIDAGHRLLKTIPTVPNVRDVR